MSVVRVVARLIISSCLEDRSDLQRAFVHWVLRLSSERSVQSLRSYGVSVEEIFLLIVVEVRGIESSSVVGASSGVVEGRVGSLHAASALRSVELSSLHHFTVGFFWLETLDKFILAQSSISI